MKLSKSETEKLTIALFKLSRSKPTLEIGDMAGRLAELLDAEAARVAALKEPTPPLLAAMEPSTTAAKK